MQNSKRFVETLLQAVMALSIVIGALVDLSVWTLAVGKCDISY